MISVYVDYNGVCYFSTIVNSNNNNTNIVTTFFQHCVVSQPFSNIVTIFCACWVMCVFLDCEENITTLYFTAVQRVWIDKVKSVKDEFGFQNP